VSWANLQCNDLKFPQDIVHKNITEIDSVFTELFKI